MRALQPSRLYFLAYCFPVGTFLALIPWTAGWDHYGVQLPIAELRELILNGWTRGALTGFGLVHLTWGAHDLDSWLSDRRAHASG